MMRLLCERVNLLYGFQRIKSLNSQCVAFIAKIREFLFLAIDIRMQRIRGEYYKRGQIYKSGTENPASPRSLV